MDLEKKIATRQSYGEALAKLGDENLKIVVLDADLSKTTKTDIFANKFPDRFFNVGIAEQNLMGVAAGLARTGFIPYVSSFAIFAAGRAYEQIRNSIAYPKLNVKICATHSGITAGEDGATHQMLEDISLMKTIPNMIVMSTSDDIQTKWAVNEISKINEPVYLRLARYSTPVIYNLEDKFKIGKGFQFGEGNDATVIATGVTVSESLKAKKLLKEKGIDIRVIDIHTIKPIDKEIIIKAAKETNKIITVEDHNVIGGLGSTVCDVLSESFPKKVIKLGINDEFGMSGKAYELMKHYKIIAEDIINSVLN